jgi:hypothetical protein
MSWLSPLLNLVVDRLIDRLATKLAEKIDIELEAAVDAALDQTEMRIRELLNGAEARLQAAVGLGQGAARSVVGLAGQKLEEAAQAAGMVPVSAVQKASKDAATDAVAVAAKEIRTTLRRQAKAAGLSPLFREVPDR